MRTTLYPRLQQSRTPTTMAPHASTSPCTLSSRTRALLTARVRVAFSAVSMTLGLYTAASGCRDLKTDPGFCVDCQPPTRDSYTGSDASTQGTTGTTTDNQAATTGGAVAADGGSSAGASTQTAGAGAQPAGAPGVNPPRGLMTAGRGSAGRPSSPVAGHAGGTSSGTSAGQGGDSPSAPVVDAGRDAETPPPPPCGRECSGATPVCDTVSRECVQCTLEQRDACHGVLRACDLETHRCVQCTDADPGACLEAEQICDPVKHECVMCLPSRPEVCPDDRSVCTEANRCVQCTAAHTQACPIDRPLCLDEACVQCLSAEQCPTLARPRCDNATHSCNGCISDADCARFPERSTCDTTRGACVQCTPATRDRCPSRECTAEHTCAPPRTMGAILCGKCDDDSMCPPGSLCVARHGVCLPEAQNGACDAQTAYRTPEPTVDSNGAERRVCGPTAPLSCDMIRATAQHVTCTAANMTPTAVCDNGICLNGACSHTCMGDRSCPAHFRCNNQQLCVPPSP